jgi:hypothetical protein
MLLSALREETPYQVIGTNSKHVRMPALANYIFLFKEFSFTFST